MTEYCDDCTPEQENVKIIVHLCPRHASMEGLIREASDLCELAARAMRIANVYSAHYNVQEALQPIRAAIKKTEREK